MVYDTIQHVTMRDDANYFDAFGGSVPVPAPCLPGPEAIADRLSGSSLCQAGRARAKSGTLPCEPFKSCQPLEAADAVCFYRDQPSIFQLDSMSLRSSLPFSGANQTSKRAP